MNQTFNILLVDDDVTVISALRRILAGVGQLSFATSGDDALRIARQFVPDLVLLDVEMPNMNGYQVCALFKSDPLLADVPIIFITGHNSIEQEVAGLSAGAVDFIGKPPSPPVVVARVRTQLRIKEMSDALRKVATTDGLTGVANRRQFDTALSREWARAHRRETSIALLLADVDHFKLYNDRYGHQGGDQCLIEVSRALRASARRPADLVARYGGEEFVLLLPDTTMEGACLVAAQLLAGVDALALPHAASKTSDHVTLSIGVSAHHTCPGSEQNQEERLLESGQTYPSAELLVRAADQALYLAKQRGRAQAWCLNAADVDAAEKALRVQSVVQTDHAAHARSITQNSTT